MQQGNRPARGMAPVESMQSTLATEDVVRDARQAPSTIASASSRCRLFAAASVGDDPPLPRRFVTSDNVLSFQQLVTFPEGLSWTHALK